MRNILVVIALFAAAMVGSCKRTQPVDPSASLEWEPNVDQPIRQLEKVLSELEQQQPRNETISSIAFLYDAKLYVLFHDFVAALPEEERVKEIEEQRRWLQERKRRIDAACAEYEGGTLASFTAGQASIDATKARIRAIEERN